MIFQVELKVEIWFDEPLASSWLRKKQDCQPGKLHSAKLLSKCFSVEQIYVSQRSINPSVKSWGTIFLTQLLPVPVAEHWIPAALIPDITFLTPRPSWQQLLVWAIPTKEMKKSLESINSRLQLMESGKYMLGYKQTLKMIRQGTAKLVILANNCPALKKSEIEYYAMLAKIGVHHYSGNNIELGTACGKYYRVCTLALTDPGDSAIIRSMPEQPGGK
nr:60S ribosomal protein L30-like [Macaca mulatta]